ncbi:MAG: ribbon-helix-helix protein, CopG family [Candidatus Bathyarchaeia archaeon]
MSDAIISIRVPSAEKRLIQKLCKVRGEDVSDFVRRAIRKELAELNFLSDEHKKALGLKGRQNE